PTAGARGDRDLTDQLGEDLPATRVLGVLAGLDGGASAHAWFLPVLVSTLDFNLLSPGVPRDHGSPPRREGISAGTGRGGGTRPPGGPHRRRTAGRCARRR